MSLAGKICSLMQMNGCKTLSILLNGRYLTNHGKRVYVELQKGEKLSFYNTAYDKETGRNNSVSLSGMIRTIIDDLTGSSLFGEKYPVVQDTNSAEVKVNPSYGVLILNSSLYQAGVKLQAASGSLVLRIGNQALSAEDSARLKQSFFMNSLVNYRDIVYTETSNRIIKHLLYGNKLYSSYPISFVPVFVNIDWLYNPLTNAESGIENTKMYKKAVECGRYLENDGVSGYFLTHREICECFNMHHFVRFNPSVWYNIFVGLLMPNLPGFPNKTMKVYSWVPEQAPPKEMKRVYTLNEFGSAYEALKEFMAEEFNHYEEINSLEAFVRKEARRMKEIGTTALDTKANTTPAKLYTYLSEAEIVF